MRRTSGVFYWLHIDYTKINGHKLVGLSIKLYNLHKTAESRLPREESIVIVNKLDDIVTEQLFVYNV